MTTDPCGASGDPCRAPGRIGNATRTARRAGASTGAVVALVALLAAGCATAPDGSPVGRWSGDCVDPDPGSAVPAFPLIVEFRDDGGFTTNAAAGYGNGGRYEITDPNRMRWYQDEPGDGVAGEYAVADTVLTFDLRSEAPGTDIAVICSLTRSS